MLALLCVGFTLPTRRVLSRPASSGGGSPPTFIRKVDGTNSSNTASQTLAGVQVDGANKLLVVGVVRYGDAVGTVTFNTTETFTRHVSMLHYDGQGTLEIWRLINPTTTTANIVVTYPGSGTSAACAAVLYNGVNQTTPLGVVATNSYAAGAANINLSVTPASATSDLMLSVFGYYAIQTYTDGAGETRIAISSANAGFDSLMMTSKTAAGTSTTMSKTWSSGTEAELIGVAVKGL